MEPGAAFLYHVAEGTDPAITASCPTSTAPCRASAALTAPRSTTRLPRVGAARRLRDRVAVLEPMALRCHHRRGGRKARRCASGSAPTSDVRIEEPVRRAQGGGPLEPHRARLRVQPQAAVRGGDLEP